MLLCQRGSQKPHSNTELVLLFRIFMPGGSLANSPRRLLNGETRCIWNLTFFSDGRETTIVPYAGLNMPPFGFLLWNYPQGEFMDLEVHHDMSRRYSELPAFPSRTERNCHCRLNCDQVQGSWKMFHLTMWPTSERQTTQPAIMKSQSQSQNSATDKVVLYPIKCTRGAEGERSHSSHKPPYSHICWVDGWSPEL